MGAAFLQFFYTSGELAAGSYLSTDHAIYHTPWVQRRIVSEGCREQTIAWLVWNDPNGIYAADDSLAEGFHGLNRERAVEIMKARMSR